MHGPELVRRRFRVGLVVLIALLAFAFAVFMVGRRSTLFARKVEYSIRFASASGLTAGNSVQLAGVTVGSVTSVSLSETPGDSTVTVTIAVERRMTSRIRTDTTAAIKTLGLLGDKYIALEGGSAAAAEIAPGGQIPAAKEAGIEKLLAGGQGLLGDLTEIAQSLKVILRRTEKGQGLLGQLTSNSRQSADIGANLGDVLRQLSITLSKINSGRSLAGRILVDEKYGKATGDSLQQAIGSASVTMGKIASALNSKNGALPALLNDPQEKEKLLTLIGNLSDASVSLAHASKNLETGHGLLPILLNDQQFGEMFRGRLDNFSLHLDSISRKLDSGSGSLGKLINDPSLFDAANDVIVGVNDSKMLRWLIRNRQKRGIKNRYDEEKTKENSGTNGDVPR